MRNINISYLVKLLQLTDTGGEQHDVWFLQLKWHLRFHALGTSGAPAGKALLKGESYSPWSQASCTASSQERGTQHPGVTQEQAAVLSQLCTRLTLTLQTALQGGKTKQKPHMKHSRKRGKGTEQSVIVFVSTKLLFSLNCCTFFSKANRIQKSKG